MNEIKIFLIGIFILLIFSGCINQSQKAIETEFCEKENIVLKDPCIICGFERYCNGKEFSCNKYKCFYLDENAV